MQLRLPLLILVVVRSGGQFSAYLSTFENAKLGDFLQANSIAGNFFTPDLTPVSTA